MTVVDVDSTVEADNYTLETPYVLPELGCRRTLVEKEVRRKKRYNDWVGNETPCALGKRGGYTS